MAISPQLRNRLSAAMLALIAGGASAPVLMDQFQQEKRVQASSLTPTTAASGRFAAV